MAEPRQPKRIQRRRVKGWKMPAGAVYVGRPTRWGNPFSLGVFGTDTALALFRKTVFGVWDPLVLAAETDAFVEVAYKMHRAWLARMFHHPRDEMLHELRGKNLACWCPLTEPCHADVLLEVANA